MAVEKRALDDLDALFRAVPDKAAVSSSSTPRPSKKLRNASNSRRPLSTPALSQERSIGVKKQQERVSDEINNSRSGGAGIADFPGQSGITGHEPHERVYARILPGLLPPGLRAAPQGARTPGTGRTRAVGAASAARLTEFVRGVLSARGECAAAAIMESRLQRKVVHLEHVPGQNVAQRAAARATAEGGGRALQGLSGKQFKKKGLNCLNARGGGVVPFRDLMGLHDLWKAYASRLVSTCQREPKVLQQRILAADLQGSYLTVARASASSMVGTTGIVLRETANTFQLVTPEGKAKTIPKRGCALRLAFGGRVITLAGRALESRGGGGNKMMTAASPLGGGTTDKEIFPLRTTAL